MMNVSRTSQYKIILKLEPILTDEERNIYHRGRNYQYKTRTQEYIHASGFEAIIGYLYLLKRNERLEEIFKKAIQICNE